MCGELIPLVHEADWTYQGCRADDSSQVFIYMYGLFGITVSAYWWARLGGAVLRCAHAVARPSQKLWVLLLADDFKVESTAPEPRREVVWFVLLLVVLGVPLSWPKTQGGKEISWIGFHLLLPEYKLGITQRRADWAVAWLRREATNGVSDVAGFRSAIGRLSFLAGALEYERPFLAPLFTFISVMPTSGIKSLPLYVRIILSHLADRIERRRHYPSAEPRVCLGDAFRVDAHAAGQEVGIGGWAPVRGADGKPSTWDSACFSVNITEADAPWAFERGAPYRAIASLEALATLVGVAAFSPSTPHNGDATATLMGRTDNRGNQYALSKLQSSKYPLCILAMELSALLESKGQRLLLRWAPREVNAEADRLANGNCSGFDPLKRVWVDVRSGPWLVLDKLLELGKGFYSHMNELKRERPREGCKRGRRASEKNTLGKW